MVEVFAQAVTRRCPIPVVSCSRRPKGSLGHQELSAVTESEYSSPRGAGYAFADRKSPGSVLIEEARPQPAASLLGVHGHAHENGRHIITRLSAWPGDCDFTSGANGYCSPTALCITYVLFLELRELPAKTVRRAPTLRDVLRPFQTLDDS